MTVLEANSGQRILLMGCGAVGGVIAAGLLRNGQDLTIVTGNPDISQAINTHGLRVTTPDGHSAEPATAYTRLGELSGRFDVVCLAMKATEVKEAAREASQYLASQGYAVTFQNGVVEDQVGEILGRERVVGSLVGWGATMHSPGEYEMTSRGELVVGELDGRVTTRVERLRETLEAAVPTTISTNIYGVLWSKLAINCVITTLGAVTGQTLGEMLTQARVRRLGMAITSEVVDVAEAHEVKLEPVGGTLDIYRLYLPKGRRTRGLSLRVLSNHLVLLLVGLRFRRLRSSMLQSMERGRRPEIDFMNGYVVAKGREKGVPTPINTALTQMVNQILAGQREVSPANLAGLLF